MASCPAFTAINQNMNGIYFYNSNTNIARITDGTSNTMLYSEKANGLFTASESLVLQLVGRWRFGRYDLHDAVPDQCVQEGPQP